ncbi:MAG: PadR family transcriptional regulator [Alloprevotella sp.]|nr:PadR family transcriptional regulator [Alloprevotella sp.]
MNIENVKSQMRKGMMEYCIMLLLRGGELYATDILGLLKDADLLVVEGTLYPLLTRLRREGVLTHRWQESSQGPPRKYFMLTAEGEAALAELDRAWGQLSGTVDSIKLTVARKLAEKEAERKKNMAAAEPEHNTKK